MLEVVPEELAPGLVAAGRFRLERRIGAGGMGDVWAATHLVTGKPLALKFLKASRAGDARSHARILLEGRAASTVRHPNVGAIHDVGELDSGLPFLVMDLLEGETLATRLARESRLDLREAAEVILPVLDAVAAAHAVGVVHRDLKPENIFLCAEGAGPGRVRVLDFGIAKLTVSAEAAEQAPLTATGEVLGTSFYMAPEQVFAEDDVDGRADVWALGVILYEVLSGERPTERATKGQVLKAITSDEIASLARRCPELPASVARIVMRMLSRDRAARPELEEVRQVLSEAAEPSRRAPARRSRLVAYGLLVAGLGAAAFAATRSPPPRATAEAALPALTPAPEASRGDVLERAPTAELPASAAPVSEPPTTLATKSLPSVAAGGRQRPRHAQSTDGGATPAGSSSGIILTHDRK